MHALKNLFRSNKNTQSKISARESLSMLLKEKKGPGSCVYSSVGNSWNDM